MRPSPMPRFSSASVSDCEDPFDYIGSSASRRHSSSKRDLRYM
uniref:Predicted protein n=1 Tax=Hordeum vulgare subsp. vulgare TaxID=112509 RepID=F2D0N6_HORVV|nr:predicted protein [Hordeum vulgare subsp. vulgare]